MRTPEERLALARLSLEGLSVGDSFGDQYFLHAETARALISSRQLPESPWSYTDDSNMALSIYENLRQYGEINQDELAQSFAEHYHAGRRYGAAMHDILPRIRAGETWRQLSSQLFEGQGSYGNGAAMRVAPLGAYFADDLDKVVEQAEKSARITHSHPEGIAGAIAVAVAAAIVAQLEGKSRPSRAELLDLVLPHVPDSEVKSGIKRARDLRSTVLDHVMGVLGNGFKISAQDTVPFTLWCASEKLSNFEEAMWLTVSALGDIDTNCAIVGGIVSLYVGMDGIPQAWFDSREPLPAWALG